MSSWATASSCSNLLNVISENRLCVSRPVEQTRADWGRAARRSLCSTPPVKLEVAQRRHSPENYERRLRFSDDADLIQQQRDVSSAP